jgi:hypothetical protein
MRMRALSIIVRSCDTMTNVQGRTTLTSLIHGESKIGKSYLGDTTPAPRLIIDLEGRAKYLPSVRAGKAVYWDPRAGGPPAHDGTWDTCVATVIEYDALDLIFQWLRSGQHPFISAVLDSLMEAQKRFIDANYGTRALDQQAWGEILRVLEGLVRKYRDTTQVGGNPLRVVVFVAGSKDRNNKLSPFLQGQIADGVAYYIDLIGYYFKAPQADGSFVRSLLIEQQPGFVAGDGTGIFVEHYGPVIATPDFGQLYQLLQSQTQEVVSG